MLPRRSDLIVTNAKAPFGPPPQREDGFQMSTDLTFNSDTTETLPGGIYNITEGPAPDQPPQNMNVDLTFAGPATIDVDNVGGGYQALHDQTINFGILTLTDRLNVSGTSTVTLKGQIFNNQGDIGVAGYYGTNLNIDANIVNNTGTLDPVQYGTVNVKADIVTNNGKMSSEPGSITIDAKILGGTGMSFLGYYASMTLEGGMVGSGQTFDMQYAYNSLTIDAPSQFHGP
jgi:hypothetical protein